MISVENIIGFVGGVALGSLNVGARPPGQAAISGITPTVRCPVTLAACRLEPIPSAATWPADESAGGDGGDPSACPAQLHMSPQTFGLGLANAGYAVGTALAVHHSWEHAPALAEVAAAIQDETQPLARAEVIRPGGRRYAGAPRSLGQWC